MWWSGGRHGVFWCYFCWKWIEYYKFLYYLGWKWSFLIKLGSKYKSTCSGKNCITTPGEVSVSTGTFLVHLTPQCMQRGVHSNQICEKSDQLAYDEYFINLLLIDIPICLYDQLRLTSFTVFVVELWSGPI